MKIILVGYMGSGKSTIGLLLSERFKIPFIDLDYYISQKEKLAVSEIFKVKGEIYFRRKETLYLQEILTSNFSFILAVGGGTPCFGSNMEMLKNMATTIYLKSSIGTLVKRLKLQMSNRPLIAHLKEEELPEFIGKHLFERTPFYQQSKYIIAVDNKTEQEITDEIISFLS